MYKYNKNTCAVAVCHSPYGPEISFHRFPKDSKSRKEWIIQCRRDGKFNPETAKVCSKHFDPSDIETLSNGRRSLKKGSVPRFQCKKVEESLDKAKMADLRKARALLR
jgi:hypothetical protein